MTQKTDMETRAYFYCITICSGQLLTLSLTLYIAVLAVNYGISNTIVLETP